METYQKVMNERLEAHYGRDIDSHPRFRLIFSDDLTEKRTVNGRVEECRKYNYIDGRWMLEVHYHMPDVTITPGEITVRDHYEPLWLWTQNKGYYYKPSFEDCQLIIYHFIEQVVKPIKANAKTVEDAEEADKQKEIDAIFDRLQQENSYLSQQLKFGEAISFAGIDGKGEKGGN